MSEKKARSYWSMGFVIAGTIVAAVAALLLAIIGVARSILAHARRALAVANEIVAHTRPIWELDQTNKVAEQLLEAAQEIEQHAGQVADALEAPQAAAPPPPPAS